MSNNDNIGESKPVSMTCWMAYFSSSHPILLAYVCGSSMFAELIMKLSVSMIYFLSIKVHLQSLVLHLLKMNQAYSQ
jgi:hypothetical protein